MQGNGFSVQYRPEIDGLRAIAVLTVIFYHAGFSFMSGGYLGVDIFFVISGFLITSIIRQEILEERFSIAKFYERRIRRILPALYVVIAASLAASWFIQTPQQLTAQFESVLSILLYVSNFYFLFQNDYFASDAALFPLIHTWSLAVEEQFYVVFPIFLILIMKQKKVDIRLILLAVCTLSLATTYFADRYDPNANFYLTTSRAWELGIGCLLAFLPAPKKITPNVANVITLLSLAIIAASMALFTDKIYHPSPFTLVPVLATALLIHYTVEGSITYRILAHKYAVRIGLYSYSAYLWHQPLFALFRAKYYEQIDPVNFLPLIILTFALAHFTWKYIETPVRNKTLIRYKSLLIALGFISILFAGFSALGIQKEGFYGRFSKDGTADIFAQQIMPKPFMTKCLQNYHDKSLDTLKDTCSLGEQKAHYDFILWGDSHAASLAYGINQSAAQLKLSGLQLTVDACPLSPELTRIDKQHYIKDCPANAAKALQIIKKIKPEYLVIQSRWALQFEKTRFDNKQGGVEHGAPIKIKKINIDATYTDISLEAYYSTYLKKLAQDMADQGTKLIIIGPTPEAGWSVPERMIYSANHYQAIDVTLPRARIDARHKNVDALFSTLQSLDNLTLINPVDIFCTDEICAYNHEAIPYYRDDDHLSNYGAVKLATYIFEQLGLE